MPDRLVDVINEPRKAVLHTFPIEITDCEAPQVADFERKAAEAAAFVQLVPDTELSQLSAHLHVDRGGPLQPYGDARDALCGTREGIEQGVRERAYFMWQAEGCPEDCAHRHWSAAQDNDLRERAYRLWMLEGCPEGKCDDHWHRAESF